MCLGVRDLSCPRWRGVPPPYFSRWEGGIFGRCQATPWTLPPGGLREQEGYVPQRCTPHVCINIYISIYAQQSRVWWVKWERLFSRPTSVSFCGITFSWPAMGIFKKPLTRAFWRWRATWPPAQVIRPANRECSGDFDTF